MDLAGPRGQWPATGHTAGPQQNRKSGPAQGQLLGKHVSGVAKGNSRALYPGGVLGTLCGSPRPRLKLPARPLAYNFLLVALTTSLLPLRFGAGTCKAKARGLENMRNHIGLFPLLLPPNSAGSPGAGACMCNLRAPPYSCGRELGLDLRGSAWAGQPRLQSRRL